MIVKILYDEHVVTVPISSQDKNYNYFKSRENRVEGHFQAT